MSIQTAKSIAGHIDQRMIDRYAHIHLADKRNAVTLALSTPIGTATDSETTIDSSELPM